MREECWSVDVCVEDDHLSASRSSLATLSKGFANLTGFPLNGYLSPEPSFCPLWFRTTISTLSPAGNGWSFILRVPSPGTVASTLYVCIVLISFGRIVHCFLSIAGPCTPANMRRERPK